MAIGKDGQRYVLRQLPAASVDRSVRVILPAGSYIDIDIFTEEVRRLGLGPDQVAVSPMARIITDEHKLWERAGRSQHGNRLDAVGYRRDGDGHDRERRQQVSPKIPTS